MNCFFEETKDPKPLPASLSHKKRPKDKNNQNHSAFRNVHSIFQKDQRFLERLALEVQKEKELDKPEKFSSEGNAKTSNYSNDASSIFLGARLSFPQEILDDVRAAMDSRNPKILLGISTHLPCGYVVVQNRLYIWDVALDFQSAFLPFETETSITKAQFDGNIQGVAFGAAPFDFAFEWNSDDMLVVSLDSSVHVFSIERVLRSYKLWNKTKNFPKPFSLLSTGFSLKTESPFREITIDECGRIFVNVSKETHLKEIKLISNKKTKEKEMVISLVTNPIQRETSQAKFKKTKGKERVASMKSNGTTNILKMVTNTMRKVFQLSKTQMVSKVAINESSELVFHLNVVKKDYLLARKLKTFIRVYTKHNSRLEYIDKIREEELIHKVREFNQGLFAQVPRNDLSIQNIFPLTSTHSDPGFSIVLQNNSEVIIRVRVQEKGDNPMPNHGIYGRITSLMGSGLEIERISIGFSVISVRLGPASPSPSSFFFNEEFPLGPKVIDSTAIQKPNKILKQSFKINNMCYMYLESTPLGGHYLAVTSPNMAYYTQARLVSEPNTLHPLKANGTNKSFEIFGVCEFIDGFEHPHGNSYIYSICSKRKTLDDSLNENFRSIFEHPRILCVLHSSGLDYFIHTRPIDQLYLFLMVMAELKEENAGNLAHFKEITEIVEVLGAKEVACLLLHLAIEPSLVIAYKQVAEQKLRETYLGRRCRSSQSKGNEKRSFQNNFVVVYPSQNATERSLAFELFLEIGSICLEETPEWTKDQNKSENPFWDLQSANGQVKKSKMTISGESLVLYISRVVGLVWDLPIGGESQSTADKRRDTFSERVLHTTQNKLSNLLTFLQRYKGYFPGLAMEANSKTPFKQRALFPNFGSLFFDHGEHQKSNPYSFFNVSQSFSRKSDPKYQKTTQSSAEKELEKAFLESIPSVLCFMVELCGAIRALIMKKDLNELIDTEFFQHLVETPFSGFLKEENFSFLQFGITLHAFCSEVEFPGAICEYSSQLQSIFGESEENYVSLLVELIEYLRGKPEKEGVLHLEEENEKKTLLKESERALKLKETAGNLNPSLLFKLMDFYFEMGAIKEYADLLFSSLSGLQNQKNKQLNGETQLAFNGFSPLNLLLSLRHRGFIDQQIQAILFFFAKLINEIRLFLFSRPKDSLNFPNEQLPPFETSRRVKRIISSPSVHPEGLSINQINHLNIHKSSLNISKLLKRESRNHLEMTLVQITESFVRFVSRICSDPNSSLILFEVFFEMEWGNMGNSQFDREEHQVQETGPNRDKLARKPLGLGRPERNGDKQENWVDLVLMLMRNGDGECLQRKCEFLFGIYERLFDFWDDPATTEKLASETFKERRRNLSLKLNETSKALWKNHMMDCLFKILSEWAQSRKSSGPLDSKFLVVASGHSDGRSSKREELDEGFIEETPKSLVMEEEKHQGILDASNEKGESGLNKEKAELFMARAWEEMNSGKGLLPHGFYQKSNRLFFEAFELVKSLHEA